MDSLLDAVRKTTFITKSFTLHPVFRTIILGRQPDLVIVSLLVLVINTRTQTRTIKQ